MVMMLKSDNPEEIFGAVTVLQSIGTADCLEDLDRVIRIADRKGFRDIYNAAVLARTVIQEKGTGKTSEDDKVKDGQQGSKDDG